LREDQEAFLLADELGYSEGYAGEHVTDLAENIMSGIVFLATRAGRTNQIRLGLGHAQHAEQLSRSDSGANSPFSKGVTEAAAPGWEPLSANFLHPVWVKSHWPKYVEGCDRSGRPADLAN
jgi:hypothetical protein